MAEQLRADICVIGGGSGGLTVAAAAAAFGISVVLVEKSKLGGECLNTGCVPSKALIAAAKQAHAVVGAARFGIMAPAAEVDFGRVHRHVHEVIAAVAPNDSRERFTGLGARVIAGAAHFKDKRTVVAGVADAACEIRARRFVIATGSSPSVPPIPGLADVPFLTNETVFTLSEAPRHLIVIGAGPVGLELAQAFRRLGAAVTVIETARALAREDPEAAAIVVDALRRDGVDLRTGSAVVRVERGEGSDVRVVVRGQGGQAGAASERHEDETALSGSHLLVATGRTPNVAGLGLEAAGIAVERGSIVVDHRLRTTNRRVYAIGDVVGALQFTHAANYHAGLVIRDALFRLRVRVDEDTVPRVTFTDPELAQTGLTEATARERGLRVRVARWPYHENDRAQAGRETAGHIKVVTDRRGRILGATIVGAQAGELITAWTLAISRRLDLRAFAGIIMPYPTLSEIGKRAATTYFIPSVTSSWIRRVIGLLRFFG
ncbi:MAG: FAD-dependent oxidoreductase [Variibacter sp.]|nr:FAD-dependent oxidoreductase [Variibacter sp.]